MGIGHVAVGLALKRADRSINVGWLIFAALLPDFLLGSFALAGWETYTAPADYAVSHYLLFTFPWSHSLLSVAVTAAVFGLLTVRVAKRRAAAVAIVIAVLSHFVLDGIVHVKGLPLLTGAGPSFGLGLWRRLPLELSLEVAMAGVGLWLYVSVRKDGRIRSIGMAVYVVVLAAIQVLGQATAVEVPPRGGLIASWLFAAPFMSVVAFWLDRPRRAAFRTKSAAS